MLLSAAFFCCGLWIVRQSSDVLGWFFAGFSTIGVVVCFIQLVPGASWLRIADDGFVMCSLFRKSELIPWKEVENFRVARLPRRGKMVVYDRETQSKPRLRAINRYLVGASDGLHDSYGMTHQRLADLLNARRERAVNR